MGGVRTREQYLEIPAEPEAAFYARDHIRRVLSKWRREELVDTAELVASELVTNAVKSTWGIVARDDTQVFRGGPGHIWLDVHLTARFVVLEVWDAGRTPPRLRVVAPDEETGRGLYLVNALAVSWGYRRPVTGGKIVWCTLIDPGRRSRTGLEDD